MSFSDLGDKEKMEELEARIAELGYSREHNCTENSNTERLTWHIYDIPRQIHFSVLSDEVIAILQEYNPYFDGRVGVSTEKRI